MTDQEQANAVENIFKHMDYAEMTGLSGSFPCDLRRKKKTNGLCSIKRQKTGEYIVTLLGKEQDIKLLNVWIAPPPADDLFCQVEIGAGMFIVSVLNGSTTEKTWPPSDSSICFEVYTHCLTYQ